MLFRKTSSLDTPPTIIVEGPVAAAVEKDTPSSPRAVVVLCGWLGSKVRHVRKYAALYEQRGCATISTVLNAQAVMLADTAQMDHLVHHIQQQVIPLLQRTQDDDANTPTKHQRIPLIFHVFSNGGAMVLHHWEERLQEMMTAQPTASASKTDNVDDSNHPQRWQIVQEHMAVGAQIFDSAPAFPDLGTYMAAVTAGLRGQGVNTVAVYFVLATMIVYFQALVWISYFRGQPRWIDSYWNHWIQVPANTPVQAYIYSTSDPITKSQKLDELTHHRRQQQPTHDDVIVQRFDDSDHVQHYIQYPDAYTAIIDQVLSKTDAAAQHGRN